MAERETFPGGGAVPTPDELRLFAEMRCPKINPSQFGRHACFLLTWAAGEIERLQAELALLELALLQRQYDDAIKAAEQGATVVHGDCTLPAGCTVGFLFVYGGQVQTEHLEEAVFSLQNIEIGEKKMAAELPGLPKAERGKDEPDEPHTVEARRP